MLKNVWQERQSQLLQQRSYPKGWNYSGLFGLSDSNPIDIAILDAFEDLMKGYLYQKELVLFPDDDLTWLLGIDDEEKCDIVEDLTTKFGYKPTNTAHLPKMTTAGDLIRIVSSFIHRAQSA